MSRRQGFWWTVALLFTLVNFGGAWIAALQKELGHAGVHVALTYLGAFFVWRLSPRRTAERDQIGV